MRCEYLINALPPVPSISLPTSTVTRYVFNGVTPTYVVPPALSSPEKLNHVFVLENILQ